MMEYSKEMTTCMSSLSRLSPMELVDLAEAIEKEHKARRDARRKKKLLAAISAFSDLYVYYNYLEIKHEGSLMNIYLTDLLKALEQLCGDC